MAYQHWLPDSDEFWEQELGALKPLETKLQPVSMGLPRHQWVGLLPTRSGHSLRINVRWLRKTVSPDGDPVDDGGKSNCAACEILYQRTGSWGLLHLAYGCH